jgi:predicted acylesterase/phospholipase RssA
MRRRALLGGLSASLVAGCSAPGRLLSLPDSLRDNATLKGLPTEVRIVADGGGDEMMGRMARAALRREIAQAEKTGRPLGPANYLAISGGGENGAYGAGLLTGWSALGTRPEFKAVTGVSTGALIAPFAYLGPAYDRQLERFYTTIGQKDVMTSNGLISAVLGESLYDSTPLFHLIRSVMNREMVAAIATEYRDEGRLLCIATANLDAPVGVLWDIGAIAASDRPDAGELIARILLASASIPGLFPPVMIDLEADSQHFQEMHVDGGTVAQVVFYPPSFAINDLLAARRGDAARLGQAVRSRPRRLWVIRNARPGTDVQTVDRSTLKIVGRAVSTLINTQGTGDLYQLYVLAQRDHIDFNATWIPASFTEKLGEPFDTNYMNKLYKVGRATIENATAWSKYPPGYSPTSLAQTGTSG